MKSCPRRLISLTTIVALIGFAATACSSSGSSSGSSGDSSDNSTYTIGVTAGLTGTSVFLFKAAVTGLEVAIDAQNAKGGVNGHKIKLDVQNDAQDASTASQQYQTFVSDGDIAIVAPTLSTIFGPLFDRANQEQIPIFGISLIQSTPIQPYVYGIDVPGDQSVSVEAPFLRELLSSTASPRVAMSSSTSAAGVEEAKVFPDAAKANGLNLATTQSYPTPLIDFSAQASHIAAAQVKAIATAADSGQGPIMMKALANDNVNVPTVGYWAAGSLATFQQINNPNWYAYYDFTDPSLTSVAGVAQMAKDASAAHLSLGTSAEVSGYYLLGEYIAAALAKCSGTCTRATLNTNLQNTTISPNGLAASVGFTPSSHTFTKSVSFYHLVDGKLTAVGSPVPVK
jgi:ABC-type branched-subunit amino acid transport system substrate-binding protein